MLLLIPMLLMMMSTMMIPNCAVKQLCHKVRTRGRARAGVGP